MSAGTTELARRISEDPRFLGDKGEFFREVAAEHGEDTAGLAWMQALLRLAQTRRPS